MGSTCSSASVDNTCSLPEAEMTTLKMKFDALAEVRSDEGYILKEDFLGLFKIPGLLGERLFAMFDGNHDNKLFWSDFTKGIEQYLFSNEKELDDFIFRFFCLNGHEDIDFEEFQSIMQHLPPSVLFVVLKNADNRSSSARKWVEQYGNQYNELPQEAVQTGITILLEAYFITNDDDSAKITYHDFSIFLREQSALRDYFKSIFRAAGLPISPIQTPSSTNNNTQSYSGTVNDSYKSIPFDPVDPEVYRSRNSRSKAHFGHPEKWQGFTRAYWCIACSYCHKEVRFCCMCQGELKPVDEEKNDGLCHLQCTECHRVVSMRYCSACGHQFEETVVDARMEIPGVNSDIRELTGDLYHNSHFNSMTKVYARIHNNFLYLFSNKYSEIPQSVSYLEKVTVEKMDDDKNSKYYGFYLQFPAAYSKYLYCTSEAERDLWIKTITDVSGVRRIEDYYDIREKIGEGRFATVYRCVDKQTLQEYAVKVINKKNLTEKERELIQTEIAILSLVQHKRIVTLIETFESNECLYIVMELLRGGELYHNICGRSILTEEEAYQIIVPLAECLSYMHSMGIIHRDIKPENILCDKNLFDVKIGDFGFSKLIFPKEKLDYPCGTLNYIAPEVITRQGYTTKADMWSLGIIFYLLLRGRLPFDGKTKEEILDQVIHGVPDYNNKSFMRLSPNCKSAIKGLLQKNPDLRLSAEDLLHHPWVTDMKKKLEQKELPKILPDLPSEKINPDLEEKEENKTNLSLDGNTSDWVRPEEEHDTIPAVIDEPLTSDQEKKEKKEEEKKKEEVKEEEKKEEEVKEEEMKEDKKEVKEDKKEEEVKIEEEEKEDKEEEDKKEEVKEEMKKQEVKKQEEMKQEEEKKEEVKEEVKEKEEEVKEKEEEVKEEKKEKEDVKEEEKEEKKEEEVKQEIKEDMIVEEDVKKVKEEDTTPTIKEILTEEVPTAELTIKSNQENDTLDDRGS